MVTEMYLLKRGDRQRFVFHVQGLFVYFLFAQLFSILYVVMINLF